MLHCGIDLSSFTIALGLIDDEAKEVVSAEIFATKKSEFDYRFEELTNKLNRFFQTVRPDVVFIEAIPYVKSARTALTLASVLGMVRAICLINCIPCHVVNNMTWKKGIGLKGRVTKDDTKQLITDLYDCNIQVLSENQYDALGVATYGYRHFRRPGIIEDVEGFTFTGSVESMDAPPTTKASVQGQQEVVQGAE